MTRDKLVMANVGCQFDRIWENWADKPLWMSFLDQANWMGRATLNVSNAALWLAKLAEPNER